MIEVLLGILCGLVFMTCYVLVQIHVALEELVEADKEVLRNMSWRQKNDN